MSNAKVKTHRSKNAIERKNLYELLSFCIGNFLLTAINCFKLLVDNLLITCGKPVDNYINQVFTNLKNSVFLAIEFYCSGTGTQRYILGTFGTVYQRQNKLSGTLSWCTYIFIYMYQNVPKFVPAKYR